MSKFKVGNFVKNRNPRFPLEFRNELAEIKETNFCGIKEFYLIKLVSYDIHFCEFGEYLIQPSWIGDNY